MRVSEAVACGLRVKMDLHGITAMYDDDQFRWISVAEAECLTGIHRTTILERMNKAPHLTLKEGMRWYLRLKLLTRIVVTYRYGKLKTRNGRWWNEDELNILSGPLSHRVTACLLNRSYDAIKVKRSKLCNHMN